MKLFEKISKKTPMDGKKYHSDDFYFGAVEAEAEANPNAKINLIDFFEDYLGVFTKLQSEKFIIIGRKGSGKTAIAEYACKIAEKESNYFADFIKIHELNLQKSIQNKNGEIPRVAHIFEWIILLKIIDMLFSNESISSKKEFVHLQKFYQKNSGLVNILDREIDEEITTNEFYVGVEYLKRFFQARKNTKFEIKESKAPFYKLIPHLREAVVDILKSSENISNDNSYYIFFDDLDINFKATNDEDISNLAQLLRITKHYNNDVFGHNRIDAKIIVLIRDDISSLFYSREADISKIISSYGIRLKWYDYQIYESNINDLPIKKLINKRIKLNIPCNDIKRGSDPWFYLINDERNTYKMLKRILDQTFSRPRDLITFFSNISSLKTNFPILQSKIDRLNRDYCTKAISEIKSELSAFYPAPQVEAIVKSVCEFHNKRDGFLYSEINQTLKKNGFTGDTETVLNELFSYSLIGQYLPQNYGGLKLRFKYREPIDEPYELDLAGKFTLHKLIYNYAKLRMSR